MKKLAPEVKEWTDFAAEDLRAAEVLLNEKIYNQSAFHSQQCAEKALKAFLLQRSVRFPRIHDLNELLEKTIRAGGVALMGFREKIGDLNLFYTPTRYPDATLGSLPDRLPNERDSRGALKTAKDLFRRILKEIAGD